MEIKTNSINVAVSGDGKVNAILEFSRFYTSLQGGKNSRQEELTQLVFIAGHGILKLYAMRAPLLFGVTHGEELAVVAP